MHHRAREIDSDDSKLARWQLGDVVNRPAFPLNNYTAFPADHPFGDIAFGSGLCEG
jgi:hypothetical protein